MEADESKMDYDYLIKIIITGDSGVGKSNIMHRYIRNQFFPDLKSTIGVDFGVKKVVLESGCKVKVQIWDTAGQERYRAVVGSYYKNAQGAILVYDISSMNSFIGLKKWIKELKESTPQDCQIMLLGNKKDLKHIREVSEEEGESFARDNSLFFMETSALEENKGMVNEAFLALASGIANKIVEAEQKGKGQEKNIKDKKTVEIKDPSKKEEEKKKGCC